MSHLESITRSEVESVILSELLRVGQFPAHAAMADTAPPMSFGVQIRRLDDGTFLVANCRSIKTVASRTGDRTFVRPAEVVARFMQSEVKEYMRGVPVL